MEKLERVIVKDFKQDLKSHKDRLMQNHRVRKRLDSMQAAARKLVRSIPWIND
jgi:splicing factor 3A subunit 3